MEHSGAALTYGELGAQASALAEQLASLGVRPGDRVGLCAPRSAAFVVGAVGILASGAVYVALDPAHPTARLQLLAQRSAVAVVVTSRSSPVELGPAVTTVELDTATGEHRTRGEAAPEPRGSDSQPPTVPTADSLPGDPAYVGFTSGSTGLPKGVVISHAGLGNLVAWHIRAFNLTADDRTTIIASRAFDASVWELWPTLVAGGSLHIPPDRLRADPVGLRDWLLDSGITVAFLPTVLAEQLITLDRPAHAALRVLLTGGDTLHRRPRRGLPFQVVNNYGVSEAAVVSTSAVVNQEADDDSSAAPSIGAAIDGVALLVVDEQLDPVADGVSGESLIGGESVGLGYLDEPALTAQAFIAREEPDGTASRWYRSGDLVRRNTAGVFEHLGRLDEQVQLRGSRVEVGEIAAVLDQHPAVLASVVVPRGEGSALQLVAYVVADDPARPGRQSLIDHAAGLLPDVMIPSAVVALPHLPATANGKVDRAALPDPMPQDRFRPSGSDPALCSDGGLSDGAAAADPELIAVVASLLAELLGLPAVDPTDNFFLLGGHSMLGAQLVARLEFLFGVEMPLRMLFQNPTAAGVAAYVEAGMVADLDALTDEEAQRRAHASSV